MPSASGSSTPANDATRPDPAPPLHARAPGPARRHRRPGLPRPAARAVRARRCATSSGSSTGSASCRSTASTSSPAASTSRSSPGSGPTTRALLDRARDRAPRRLVEYWAHEASLIPPSTWPLLDFRMRAAAEKAWGGMRRILAERPDFVDVVRAEVEAARPDDGARGRGRARPRPAAPQRPLGLELVRGQAGARVPLLGRADQLGRAHHAVRAPVCRPRRHRAAARCATRGPTARARRPTPTASSSSSGSRPGAHGVGTERCLPTTSGSSASRPDPAIARLVADGELVPVTVPGWQPAWLHAEARVPRRVHAEALLSPFDSLVWQRERIHALWDFHYRIEIYTPAAEAGARLLRAALPLRRRASSRGATSRPTAGPAGAGCCAATGSRGSPTHRPRRSRGPDRATSSRWRSGWDSTTSRTGHGLLSAGPAAYGTR